MLFLIPLVVLSFTSILSAELGSDGTGTIDGIYFGPSVDLSGQDLQGFNLYDANLRGVDFTDADLSNADLDFADCTDAIFTGANLSGASFIEANLTGANLVNVNLQGAILRASNLKDCDISGANLQSAVLTGATLNNVKSKDLIGNAIVPYGYLIIHGYLVGPSVNLSQATLEETDFRNMDLSGAVFYETKLTGSNFTGANLNGATFQSAELSGVLFSNASFLVNPSQNPLLDVASMTWTRFDNSDLTGSDFSMCILDTTSMYGADLSGARFTGVIIGNTTFNDTIWANVKTISEYNQVELEKSIAVSEKNTAIAEKNAAVSDRDQAFEERDQAIFERDSRYTRDQFRDLREGSTLIEVNDGNVIVSVGIEESTDLIDWEKAHLADFEIPFNASVGSMFYRTMFGSSQEENSNNILNDSDGDTLLDIDEIEIYKTNPNLSDSDLDGVSDGIEVRFDYTDPKDIDSFSVNGVGLVSVYNFNENTFDYSGNGYHLNHQGELSFENSFNDGKAILLNDPSDGLIVESMIDNLSTGSHSFAVWFKQIDSAGSQILLGLGQTDLIRSYLQLVDGKVYVAHGMEKDGGRYELTEVSDYQIDVDTWNHLIMTVQGNDGTIKVFLNGSLLGQVNAGINLASPSDLHVGAIASLPADDQWRQGFYGLIDQARLYNKVLDDAEAFTLFESEAVDSDKDGVFDIFDAFPNDPTETVDSDGDGVGNNADAFPDDPTETVDSDGDGVGDNADVFPNDPTETTDSDDDGVGDNADAFPNDPTETTDSDGDGVGDNADVFPNDPTETVDSDGDGVGNNADAFPNDPTETVDSDGDGVGDNADAFPNDPTETTDSDGDGVGNNADAFPNDPTESTDSDGDGVGNNADAFPDDPTETVDSDGDGVGNNADAFPNDPTETVDSDGDGVGDNADAFPNDPTETVDSDGDGVGDNADAFPDDPTETTDSDGDGVGDNSETNIHFTDPNLSDTDRDGVLDGIEVLIDLTDPNNAEEYFYLSQSTLLLRTYALDNNAYDISGNEAHGELATEISLSKSRHESLSSIDFQNDQYLSVPSIDNENLTISLHYKPNLDYSNFTLHTLIDSVANKHHLLIHNINNRFGFWQTGFAGSDLVPEENNWMHIVLTISANEWQLYCNGVLINEVSSVFDNTLFPINGFGNANVNFVQSAEGSLDDIKVFNRVLEAGEIKDLYEFEAPNWLLINGSFTWEAAYENAISKNGRLAVLDTEEKVNAALAYLDKVGSYDSTWIGATDKDDENIWKWINGNLLEENNPNWKGGEGYTNTGNNPDIEDYLIIWASNNGYDGKFADTSNDTPSVRHYLFELNKDPDGDSLYNFTEEILGTDPHDADSDNDTYLDANDAFPLGASEWLDTDGDDIGNNADTDDDNDGLLDIVETNTGIWVDINDTGTDPKNADSDGDGLSDLLEVFMGDPLEFDQSEVFGSTNFAIKKDFYNNISFPVYEFQEYFPENSSNEIQTEGENIHSGNFHLITTEELTFRCNGFHTNFQYAYSGTYWTVQLYLFYEDGTSYTFGRPPNGSGFLQYVNPFPEKRLVAFTYVGHGLPSAQRNGNISNFTVPQYKETSLVENNDTDGLVSYYDFSSKAPLVGGGDDVVTYNNAQIIDDPIKGEVLRIQTNENQAGNYYGNVLDTPGGYALVDGALDDINNNGDTDFSFSIFFKLEETHVHPGGSIVNHGVNGSNYEKGLIGYRELEGGDNDMYLFTQVDEYNYLGELEPLMNSWVHYVMTVENDTVKLYINGNEISEYPGGTYWDSSMSVGEQLLLGKSIWDHAASTRITACYDDLKVYNRALTADEVTVLNNENIKSNLSLGLLAHYQFMDGFSDSGIHAQDAQGTNVTINPDGAAYFSGDSYLDLPFKLNDYASATFTAWVNAEDLSGVQGIISQPRSSYGTGFSLNVDAGTITEPRFASSYLNYNGFSIHKTVSVLVDPSIANNWIHLASVLDGKNEQMIKLYLNGELVASKPLDQESIGITDENILIGREFYNGSHGGPSGVRYFKGHLDEVRIYDRPLNAEEIEYIALNLDSDLDGITDFDELTLHGTDLNENGSEYFTYSIENGEVTITSYNGADSIVLIPSTIESMPVAKIGFGAFSWRSDISKVILPTTVKIIDDQAFRECLSLEAIVLPEGLEHIGDTAFGKCASLAAVSIPQSVIEIEPYAFSRCYDLESVVIPQNVNQMGRSVFFDCTNLETVDFYNNLPALPDYTFEACTSLKFVRIFTDTLADRNSNAFTGCDALIAVTNSVGNYSLIRGNFNWENAKSDAESKGGQLAILDTQEKVNIAAYLLLGHSDSIAAIGGLRVNGSLRWISGNVLDIQTFDWTENNPESEPYLGISASSKLLDISNSDASAINYLGYIFEHID